MLRANLLFRCRDKDVKHAIPSAEPGFCCSARGAKGTTLIKKYALFLTKIRNFRGKNLRKVYFPACAKGYASAYCCGAVSRSSIARPPPFLGVSSLNLAAPRSGHFFWRIFCSLAVSPRRSLAKPTSLAAPGQAAKSLAKNAARFGTYSAASGGLRRLSEPSGKAVSRVSASVSFCFTASKAGRRPKLSSFR